MSTTKRVLLVLAAFGIANMAAFIILNRLGVERGEWRYALAIGVIVAIANGAWRMTAARDRPTKNSS
jgi:hypothetical protein